MKSAIAIVIVTHNSEEDIQHCLDCISGQKAAVQQVVIVDSGSDSTEYLEKLNYNGCLEVIYCDNIGYGKANNIGFQTLTANPGGVVVFINPDTFLTRDFSSTLTELVGKNADVTVFSARLLGFDRQHNQPNGRLDSTGVFRKWYGRWIDRGRGELDNGQYMAQEVDIPAACGALLCCRLKDLQELDGQIFDPDFFLYKEDIEFSLRMRKRGKRIGYFPELTAYHCRGWRQKRKTMALELRTVAAKNEVLLYRKHPSPYILWALFKLILVRFLNV